MMQGKGVSTSQAKASSTSGPPSPAPHPPPQISTRLTDWSKNMVVEILSSKSLGGNHYKALTRFDRWSFRAIAIITLATRSDRLALVDSPLAKTGGNGQSG